MDLNHVKSISGGGFKSWLEEKYPVTDDLVERVGTILDESIKEGNGKWRGSINELMMKAGVTQDEIPDKYGTYYNAIREAKKRLGINCRKIGVDGGEYSYAVGVKPLKRYLDNASLRTDFPANSRQ